MPPDPETEAIVARVLERLGEIINKVTRKEEICSILHQEMKNAIQAAKSHIDAGEYKIARDYLYLATDIIHLAKTPCEELFGAEDVKKALRRVA